MAAVRGRRRAQRSALIAQARAFAGRIDPALGVRAVAVFGSVARGDFNDLSDVDLLVVADRVPRTAPARLRAVGWPYGGPVQPIVWTPSEYRDQRRAGNLIAIDAEESGVWLVGTPPGAQANGS